eukprot:jgi/Mesen1/5245/ME000262S04317
MGCFASKAADDPPRRAPPVPTATEKVVHEERPRPVPAPSQTNVPAQTGAERARPESEAARPIEETHAPSVQQQVAASQDIRPEARQDEGLGLGSPAPLRTDPGDRALSAVAAPAAPSPPVPSPRVERVGEIAAPKEPAEVLPEKSPVPPLTAAVETQHAEGPAAAAAAGSAGLPQAPSALLDESAAPLAVGSEGSQPSTSFSAVTARQGSQVAASAVAESVQPAPARKKKSQSKEELAAINAEIAALELQIAKQQKGGSVAGDEQQAPSTAANTAAVPQKVERRDAGTPSAMAQTRVGMRC